MTSLKKPGPATEEIYTVSLLRDLETGIVVSEQWSRADTGQPHRTDGPAMIGRDRKTGVIVHEVWCQNGELHRTDGPANIMRKAETGRVFFSEWVEHGKKVKPPKPAHPNTLKASTNRPAPSPAKRPSPKLS